MNNTLLYSSHVFTIKNDTFLQGMEYNPYKYKIRTFNFCFLWQRMLFIFTNLFRHISIFHRGEKDTPTIAEELSAEEINLLNVLLLELDKQFLYWAKYFFSIFLTENSLGNDVISLNVFMHNCPNELQSSVIRYLLCVSWSFCFKKLAEMLTIFSI